MMSMNIKSFINDNLTLNSEAIEHHWGVFTEEWYHEQVNAEFTTPLSQSVTREMAWLLHQSQNQHPKLSKVMPQNHNKALDRLASQFPREMLPVTMPHLNCNWEYSEPEWLVEDLIPNRGVGILYGESGSYKSFVACELARTLAYGHSELFGKSCDSDKQVLYICGEGANGINIRLKGVGDKVWRFGRDLKWKDLKNDIDKLVGALKPSLIIYDTVNSLDFGIDNNNSGSVSGLFRMLQDIKPDCAHLMIHHANKSGDSMEGSHVFKSNADFVLQTEQVGDDQFTLSVIKQKDAARGKPIDLSMLNGRVIRTEVAVKALVDSDHEVLFMQYLFGAGGKVSPSCGQAWVRENLGKSHQGARDFIDSLASYGLVLKTGQTSQAALEVPSQIPERYQQLTNFIDNL